MTNEAKTTIAALVVVAVAVAVSVLTMITILLTLGHKDQPPEPTCPSVIPTPSASVSFVLTPPPDFDFEKKDRQIDWCYAHHGVPAMTFTHDRSNVLCLKSGAMIELPRGDAGR